MSRGDPIANIELPKDQAKNPAVMMKDGKILRIRCRSSSGNQDGAIGGVSSTRAVVILRSRALARRLEGWTRALVVHPSRLAEDGGHLRMTVVLAWYRQELVACRARRAQ
jgi:hypothetical protein